MKERKNKLEIAEEIIDLLQDGKGYNYQQIAKKIKSHWISVRDLCDFLVKYQIIKRIETMNHQWICYIDTSSSKQKKDE